MTVILILLAFSAALATGQVVPQQPTTTTAPASASSTASTTQQATAQGNAANAQPAGRALYSAGYTPAPAPVYQAAAPVYAAGNYQAVSGNTLPQINYINWGQSGNAANQAQAGQGNQAAQVLSAVDASRQLIAAAIQQGSNPNNFGVVTNARYNIAQQPNPQVPNVWDALNALRGRGQLTIDEILNILASAVAGRDYPYYNDIPNTRFSCETVKQAGFYADTDAQCQVIRRCDINGVMWSYLCPNMTLFNQITLVCDWFFNVNCQYSTQYYDYSNPRLYTQFPLLDTPGQVYNAPRPTNAYVLADATYAAPVNTGVYANPVQPAPYTG